MIGSGKKEGWPECFQDLGSWCPLPPDELHTPKVTLQDEFNFSIDDGHVNDWDILSSPVDLQCDPWGNDTQFGISTCQPILGEVNSNSIVQEGIPLGVISNKTPNLLGSGGKLLYTITTDGSRSPLKSKGNVLLSQGIVKTASDDSTFLNMAATYEHKSNNKPVVIGNDCYLLPLTVPEFASAKLNSSSLSTSFITPPQQSPSLPPQQSPTKKVSMVKENTLSDVPTQTNKLENKCIKQEHSLEDSFKVPIVCKEGGGGILEVEPTPSSRRNKPPLKLNIVAANNTSKFSSTLSTPEVLKPLVDGDTKEFNLLQYVCNDSDYPDLSQEVEEDDGRNLDHSMRDHDYTDPSWISGDIKADIVIKSEPGSPASTSYSISNKNASKGRPRKRRRDSSSDYVASDSDGSLSEDDSQQEWVPTPAKKRTKRKSSINCKTNIKNNNGGKRTGRRRNSNQINGQGMEIDTGQDKYRIGTGQDKYRALRERNNEASRRSRMNRKQRDEEMLHISNELHKKNVYLKARAEKMESLVKYMRAEIMKALTKPK